MGGGTESNCSMLEAIAICEEAVGQQMRWQYTETNRIGDHIWYVSDLRRFRKHYPNWKLSYNVRQIIHEIVDSNRGRWQTTAPNETTGPLLATSPAAPSVGAVR